MFVYFLIHYFESHYEYHYELVSVIWASVSFHMISNWRHSGVVGVVLVSLLLTLNIFYTLF